jgi:alcohol dehydrogenase
MLENVRDALGDGLAVQFTGVVPDTGIDIIDEAANLARESGADSVVSVGGGSSIDTAKAVAAMLGTEAGSVRNVIGFSKLKQKPAPHVAIPTTAGTGSESTCMAVIKDREAGKKLIPDAGILDPLLSVTMPRGVTASTGMDAMTHAAESIMSKRATPPTDALALHAVSLITKHLPRAVENGDDLEARGMMLVASNLAGQAFQNALVGVVHAMAHALGGIVGVPHGLANGILLWVGMEYNAGAAPDRVAMIGKAMGMVMSGDAGRDAALSVEGVKLFSKKIGIPERLRNAGVDDSCLAEVAALALDDPALSTNPRKPEEPAEIEALFKKCM